MINVVKQKMIAGQPAHGIVLSIGSPMVAGILGHTGFDFVMIDYQHGDWDDTTALAAVRAISLSPAVPVARVRENDYAAIGRALDRGVLGIVVPMVNSPEEACAAAAAMRYPPNGGRSSADNLAVHYGSDYRTWADKEVFLAVQIETAQAAAQAEEIMAVDGVDACWIGPMDLALSLGVAQGAPAHEEAILGVLEACRKTGKIPGLFTPDIKTARRRLDQGFQFVTISVDISLLSEGGHAILQQLSGSS